MNEYFKMLGNERCWIEESLIDDGYLLNTIQFNTIYSKDGKDVILNCLDDIVKEVIIVKHDFNEYGKPYFKL